MDYFSAFSQYQKQSNYGYYPVEFVNFDGVMVQMDSGRYVLYTAHHNPFLPYSLTPEGKPPAGAYATDAPALIGDDFSEYNFLETIRWLNGIDPSIPQADIKSYYLANGLPDPKTGGGFIERLLGGAGSVLDSAIRAFTAPVEKIATPVMDAAGSVAEGAGHVTDSAIDAAQTVHDEGGAKQVEDQASNWVQAYGPTAVVAGIAVITAGAGSAFMAGAGVAEGAAAGSAASVGTAEAASASEFAISAEAATQAGASIAESSALGVGAAEAASASEFAISAEAATEAGSSLFSDIPLSLASDVGASEVATASEFSLSAEAATEAGSLAADTPLALAEDVGISEAATASEYSISAEAATEAGSSIAESAATSGSVFSEIESQLPTIQTVTKVKSAISSLLPIYKALTKGASASPASGSAASLQAGNLPQASFSATVKPFVLPAAFMIGLFLLNR